MATADIDGSTLTVNGTQLSLKHLVLIKEHSRERCVRRGVHFRNHDRARYWQTELGFSDGTVVTATAYSEKVAAELIDAVKPFLDG